MIKYDQEHPILSWLRLILCFSIVCTGTAGAISLLWRIYWVAGVVVSYPVSILLIDLLLERKKSFTWYLNDFLRHILVFGGTVVAVQFLWKINWLLGATSAIPIFILLLNLFGFLTLPLYYFTPETRADHKEYNDFLKKDDDFLKNIQKIASGQRDSTSVTDSDQKTP